MAKKKNTLKPVGTYAKNMNNMLQTLKKGNGTIGSYQERINSLKNFMAKARDEERKRQAEAEQQQRQAEAEQQQRERESNIARTQIWKQATQDAKYGQDGQDRSHQVYAAKMMADTDGAIEKERQRELDRSRKETQKMRQLTQDLTYGYGGRYDPFLAYQAAQMGVKADKVRKYVEKEEENNKNWLNIAREIKAQEKAQEALTFKGVKSERKANGTGTDWTLTQQFGLEGKRKNNQAEGLNDNGYDPFHMSAEGRKAYRSKLEKEAEARRTKIKEYEDYDQDNALSYLYETMYNRDLANEQAILDNPVYRGTDFERNAQARKAELESGYNEGWRRAYDNAQRLIESGRDIDSMTDEEIYDLIMPDYYKERTKTNRDLQAMKQIINDFRTGLKTPWGEGSKNDVIGALQREASAYDSAIQDVDKAQKYYDMLDRYKGLADSWDLETGYNAALLPAQPKMYFDDRVGDYVPEPQGDETDKAYWWANNYQTLNGAQDRIDFVNKYMFIAQDPEILAMFNEFYAKDKENQLDRLHGLRSTNYAQKFLEGLDPYLTTMLVEYQNNVMRSRAEDPFAGTVARLAGPMLNTVGGIEGTIGAITGQKLDSPLYWTSRIVSETRSQQNEDVAEWANRVIGDGSGEVAKFLLGVIDSISDNVAAMGTGTALAGQGTKGAMRLVQLIMSGSATSNKMVESLANGMDPTEAALYAVGDGIIEWITEKYSLEQIMGPDVRQLYGNKRAIASFLARSAGAEGSEEIASGLLNTGLDSILSMIYGHEDEIKKRYNELVTVEGKSDAEASRIAIEEKLREIGLEGLAGAISGLGMAGSRVITTAMETGRQGKTLQTKNGGLDTMLNLAQKMNEGTESRTLADKLKTEIEKGSAVSNYDLGRLANLTAMDVGDTRSQVIRDTIGRNVQQQLMDAGIGEQEAKQYGEIITRSIFEGKRLSKSDIQTLGQDERAVKLWGDFNTMSQASRNLAAEVKAETKPLDSIADKVSDLITPETKQGSAAASAVEESIKATDTMEEAIDNLQAKNSGLLSESYAKLMKDELANNPQAKNSKTYLDDVMKIRLAAMTGDSMPKTALDKDVAQRFFDAAKAEFDEVDADRVVPQAPAMEGQGKATFNGAEYGTDAWKQATNGLSKATRNVMGAVGEVAARFGYRVNLVNDPDNPDIYGFEDANTGAITINVANGFKHHMLVTLPHEMTHWLEQNSRGGYNDLRSFVLESLRKEGVNVQERIVKIIDNYNMVMKPEAGKGMTINQAMAELVAQSSEGLLSSRRAAMELQSVNPSLYGRIQNFVKNVVARLDAAIHSMEYEASMSQEAKALKNYREQLADIWFNGRKDAQGNKQILNAEDKGESKDSYSLRVVEPVKSSDNSIWQPGHTETWFRENGFPIYQDVPLDQQEINRDTSKKGHGTQIASTESTYRKLFDRIKAQNPDGWAKMRILDASSGLGMGTKAGREMGFNVTDIEPFPNSTYKPDYTDYAELERQVKSGKVKPFDFIISNAVLNVVPQDTRDNLVAAMSNLLKPGGSIFVNVISKDYAGAMQSNPNLKESLTNRKGSARTMEGDYTSKGNAAGRGHETFVWGSNSVQKVFSTPELIGYLKDALGSGFTVKRDNIGMTGVMATKQTEVRNEAEKPQNVQYSVAQRDEAYQQAVESGNVEEQQRLVDQAAKEAGYTEHVYHGSDAFGFTSFDMDRSQGQVFVAYDKELAATYSEAKDVRNVSEGGIEKSSTKELAEILDRQGWAALYGGLLENENDRASFKYNEETGKIDIYLTEFDDEFDMQGHLVQVDSITREQAVEAALEQYEALKEDANATVGKAGIYDFYAKPGKQLVIDAKGSSWHSISVQWSDVPLKTRDIGEYAKANNYNSVRINNVVDTGGYVDTKSSKPQDIGIFFNTNDVKSADAITYDDEGNVIPPSKRFNEQQKDIRYSVAQRDEAYMQAVDSGNVEEQQRLVDKAAEQAMPDSKVRDKNGKLLKMYHGTKADFNVFDTSVSGGVNGTAEGFGIYLADSQEVTEKYGDKQIASYVDMKRPARDDQRTIRKNELVTLIRKTCVNQAENMLDEGEADNMRDALRDTWISNYVYTPGFSSIDGAYAEVADTILQMNDNDMGIVQEVMAGMAIRDYEDAMDFYHNMLTPTIGVDGYWTVWHNNETGKDYNVLLAFDSSQIKKADPITYDDQGNVIPISERFNTKNEDIRYSIAQSPDMEVNNFMMGLNEFNLPTYQEKTMLRQYKDARTRAELLRYGIREREAERKKLLAMEKRSLKDNKRLSQINDFLTRDRAKLDQLEKTMVEVTKGKGYARLMMNQENIMKNLTSGQSAAELEETVSNIQKNLDDVTREMDERAEELKKLASAEAVVRIRQQFDSRGLKRIAARLKADINSELQNTEIENRLAMIALKMKEGKYDAENAEELADMLAGRMRAEYDGYVISELRGSTITLGPAQLKELKGSGRTLNDIRQQLAGTGIRIGTKGNTTLDEKWEDLCKVMPTLDPNTNPGDMLDTILNLVNSEKSMRATVYSDENLMKINERILTAAQELIPEIITDEKSLKLIRESMALVAGISGAAKSNAEAMADINAMIDKLQKKAKRAVVQAKKITGDIESTIEYFDQLSLQSEAAMWKSERIRLIEQMKSDNTKALMEEADRWRERIEKDKAFREAVGENQGIRRKITTNTSRIRKLLINETDLKNIPEHMKGLARELLGKIVGNDLTGRKVTNIEKQDLIETARVLEAMKELDGEYSPDDLRLIADEEAQSMIADALADLEEGLEEYNGRRRGAKDENVKAVHDTLQKIQDAVATISGIINAERSVSFLDRQVTVGEAADDVRKDFQNTRFRGELKGRGSKAATMATRTVVYGNMTPEYYIENLRNRGMTELWQDMKRGENRNGLEVRKAQEHMAQLAAETNYKAWANEKHDVILGGMKRTITIGNMMELYAIWKREQTSNPEMSQHLNKGGVYFQEEEKQTGKLRHEQTQQRAIRVTDEEIQAMYNSMTAEQKQLIDGVVKYLSNDMSDLGNEASMRMYGIKKYKETYYFPMKVWDGVKSARSDKGITGTDENRAAHKSWSKRRQHMARNALVIGDFMTDAVNHIVEMINYNTMAPSIENINKVLNYRFTEEAGTDNETQRNLRVMFRENYGLESLKYLEDLLKDLNGGPAQDQRKTLRDRLLSVFKKNAVAGSMSVALQQPLSYIRAAMMINPKYLAEGLATFWKGSYQEMISHSGVAVIKDMGRFDMNFGQSAKDYITPETKKNLYNKASDVLTKAPELMDRMTWTRMWAAVKAEQAARNPGMDIKSEAFMNKVTERFNDLMRKTQVYDSILVKSSNMRSTNLGMKVITSFMAEPTLSLNVLADAFRNAGAEGGKKKLAKALATFLISAVMQSGVKALMGSGRTPDKKKTWTENFLNKLQQNLMNEANPASLIPGYSDIIEVLKTGELRDDAMGAIGKLFSIVETTRKAMGGNGKGAYRDLEDTVGQFAQLFTNIPAKNLMRDARAVYNWISGTEYASRPTSGNVLKHQAVANLVTGDGLVGTLNAWLGEAGFVTTNGAYYGRIYNAMKNGNTGEAEGLKEYMSLGKGTSDEAMKSGLKAAAKKDTSMTEAERSSWMISNGLMDNTNTVTTQYKEGKITRAEAEKLYKEINPEIKDNDLWWKLDRMDYQKETGADSVSGYSYRLKDAIQNNKADEIRKVVEDLIKHGRTQTQIKNALSDWKSAYLEADARGKTAIRDAIQKAYKAMGLTAADADKVINGWKKSNKKTN